MRLFERAASQRSSLAGFVLSLSLLLGQSEQSHASNVDMSGSVSVAPAGTGYVTLYVQRIDNYDLIGLSGSLRLEYWALDTPYDGSSTLGHQLATASVGQLLAGYYFSNVSQTVPISLPPYGFYYPTLVMTEYTLGGWVPRDWVTFSGQFMGTAPDFDGDGWADLFDNCPLTWNPSQANSDSDLLGDACDICPFDSADDADSDGWCANGDNCPFTSNASQQDSDIDGLGDACDSCSLDPNNDADGDSICANLDNCPGQSNQGQEDGDHDGIGDLCDSTPLPVVSSKCLADQLKAAGSLCKSELSCQARYAANPSKDPGFVALAACLAGAEAKFASAYQRAASKALEKNYICTLDAPVLQVAGNLGDGTDLLTSSIEGGWDSSDPIANKLHGSLLKGAGAMCGSVFSIESKYVSKPDPVARDASRLRARGKLSVSTTKAIAQAVKSNVYYEGLAIEEVANQIEGLVTSFSSQD